MNHTPDATPDIVDWAAVIAAVNRAAAVMRDAAKQAAAVTNRITRAILIAANDPVHVAGLEGKWIARGGLDPAYRWEDNARVMAATLAHGRHPDTTLLTCDNRARVATAFLRGWVHTHHRAELAAIAAEPTPTYDALAAS